MDKISVIIPCYNSSKSINKTLYSVINQSFNNIEIVLIDDGSYDESSKKCDEILLRDCRVIVFHNHNSGVSASRNIGLSIASGSYIIFVDSDDEILPDYFEKLYRGITANNYDICCCGYVFNGIFSYTHNDYYSKNNNSVKNNYLIRLFNHTGGTVWCKIYKKFIIDAANIKFDKVLNMCEDQLFNLLYFLNSKNFISINYNGYYYNETYNSLSSTVSYNKWYHQLELLDDIKRIMCEYSVDKKTIKQCIELKCRNVLFSLTYACIRENKNLSLILGNEKVNKYLKFIRIKDKFSLKYILPLKLKNKRIIEFVYR